MTSMAQGRIDVAQLAAVVHGIDQARAAARVALRAKVPLVLHSPADGVRIFGPLMFREMVDALRREFPGLKVTSVLDCGDASGRALAAIRAGVDAVRVDAMAEVAARISAIADAHAVRIAGEPLPPLDLGRVDDPEAACRFALGLPAPSAA